MVAAASALQIATNKLPAVGVVLKLSETGDVPELVDVAWTNDTAAATLGIDHAITASTIDKVAPTRMMIEPLTR